MSRTAPTHFPAWLASWFYDELTAESRDARGRWQRVARRNEARDLYAYALAAAVRLGADRMDWDAPRPWALPWDGNPEILPGEGEDPGQPGPSAPAARRVWFRVRG